MAAYAGKLFNSTMLKFKWDEHNVHEVAGTYTLREYLTENQQNIIAWAKPQPYPDARKMETGYELLSTKDFEIARENDSRAKKLENILGFIDNQPGFHVNWYDSLITITNPQHVPRVIATVVSDA